MKIWPLGTGGWMPAFGRQTSASLIEYRNRLILIDAGTGLSRLSDFDSVLERFEEVDLILTHYHQDHLMGLFFLPKFLKGKRLTIWGPGKPYYDASCQSIIKRSADQPFGTKGYETIADQVICKDYTEDGFKIGTVQIGITRQNHTLPSFGITIDDKVHLATDTDVNPDVFLKPVKLLLHECWAQTQEMAKEHASMQALIKAYKEHKETTEIESVGIIHRNPAYSDTEYAQWMKSPFFIVHENELIKI